MAWSQGDRQPKHPPGLAHGPGALTRKHPVASNCGAADAALGSAADAGVVRAGVPGQS